MSKRNLWGLWMLPFFTVLVDKEQDYEQSSTIEKTFYRREQQASIPKPDLSHRSEHIPQKRTQSGNFAIHYEEVNKEPLRSGAPQI